MRPTGQLSRLFGLAAFLVGLLLSAPAFAWLDVPASAYDEGALHDGDARVESRLITDVQQVAPGDTFRVGIAFEMAAHWHIYWQNPGDAGLPTDITWSAGDQQVSFGPIRWSAPEMFEESDGEVTVFGYDDRIILFSEATVSEEAAAGGSIELAAEADYLACGNACMPGHSRMTRTIPVGEKTVGGGEQVLGELERFGRRVPREAREAGVEVNGEYAKSSYGPGDEVRAALEVVVCEVPGPDCPEYEPEFKREKHAFIPDDVSRADVHVAGIYPHPTAHTGWIYELKGSVRESGERTKDLLTGVLRFRDEGDESIVPVYVRRDFPFNVGGGSVDAQKLELLERAEAASGSAAAGKASGGGGTPASPPMSVAWALVLAFLGGMVLNLMPCVFPVLAFKVSSFTRVVQESRSGIFAHGAAYTGGIVGSLMSLALVVIGLRAAGTQVGWGFQFQHPEFAAVLSVGLVVFALNLFDVFDVGVQSNGLNQATDEASGVGRSFGEGVLAVILATPCSAPFLGTAVGFAFAGSSWLILAIFLTLGLGLAAPFVVLSMVPGWAKLLPDPGDWMKYLKQFLGLTLVGTSVWLVWIVGRQAGVDAMAGVLMLMAVTGTAVWLYGLVQYGGGFKKWGTAAVAATAIVAAGVQIFPIESASADTEAAVDQQEGPIDWTPWSKDAVQSALQEGRPVFVDFTADWCLTCKVNEKNAITVDSVVQAAQRHDVAMLKADWTHQDERIRKALRRHGKAGVPMYLMYAPESPGGPTVLPEILSADMLVDAFEKAAGQGE